MLKQMIDGIMNVFQLRQPPMPHGQRITGRFKATYAKMISGSACFINGKRIQEYIITPSGAWIRKENYAKLSGVRSLFG
jgi:hypothetical protein